MLLLVLCRAGPGSKTCLQLLTGCVWRSLTCSIAVPLDPAKSHIFDVADADESLRPIGKARGVVWGREELPGKAQRR